MKKRSLTTALSVATLALLETGCSDGGSSGSAPNTVSTSTPAELVGLWASRCVLLQSGTSSAVVSISGTSGGGFGGNNSTGGQSVSAELNFTQNGSVSGFEEFFATTSCNTNFLEDFYTFNADIRVGNQVTAADGSLAIEIDFIGEESTTYSIYQVINGSSLYIGSRVNSTSGKDGSSEENRFDGFGYIYDKVNQ